MPPKMVRNEKRKHGFLQDCRAGGLKRTFDYNIGTITPEEKMVRAMSRRRIS